MTRKFRRSTADTASEMTRRYFLGGSAGTLGLAALASLLNHSLLHSADEAGAARSAQRGGLPGLPHHAPRAKRAIFLFQSGAPSQIDLWDAKPELLRRDGEELPESIRSGQRLTTMTSDQATKPLTPSMFRFERHGRSGTPVSELLPYTSRIVDDLCIVHSLHTEAINHDPAITMLQTGSQQPGRPSMGAWVSYGLGSVNENLPAYTVLISGGALGDQPLFGRLWGAGFLPTVHQAVPLRAGHDPILYLSNPPGISKAVRRELLDGQAELNRLQYDAVGDPEIAARIEQFELAYRLQSAAPELCDVSRETEEVFDLYGESSRTPGTYAANCLLARRMMQRGVRFVQLFHRGWDHHDHLPTRIREKCLETDQASAALVHDLKRLGMFEDTLVVWAGEFGRTAYCQGERLPDDYGRDHHPRCFSIWMAGGGVRAGLSYGRTDEFSYNIVENPMHVHDLHATILHLLGIDHERLTFAFQGRHFRLTDVAGHVVYPLLA